MSQYRQRLFTSRPRRVTRKHKFAKALRGPRRVRLLRSAPRRLRSRTQNWKSA